MRPTTHLGNYSQRVYEHTMITRFEKKLALQKRKQFLIATLIAIGTVGLILMTLASGLFFQGFINRLLLGS